MNSEKLEQVWSEVCGQVKSYNNIDPSQINAFFSRLHPQAMSDGFLMITADNDFIKTWIERHYVEFIKRALNDLYHMPFTVIIEVDITAAEPPAPAPAPPAAQAAPAATMATAAETPAPVSSPQPAAGAAAHAASSPQIDAGRPEAHRGAVGEEVAGVGAKREIALDGPDSPASTLTFENFVIGDSNRMAYSMAVAVAEMPGKAHLNPLFIYGKSGLGKTHLMRAIQNYINETMPQLSTIYVASAELLSDYMEASAAHDKQKSSYKNFKTRYEEADVLLIDDVQYLQGKKQTLDIVFQIFNKLTSQGRQVVLSADRAPKNIDIDERYRSRFNSGGTFDIHFTGGPSKRLTIADIQKEVENFYKVSHADLVGKKRTRNIIYARQIAIYLCRQMLDLPFNDIGKKFNRDHSTVMYSVTNVEEKMKENRELREELEALRGLINEM